MTAYYNEFDAYPAAWLRNLADAGHIAPGTVDERSIADISPADLEGYEQAHFFAGIGGWSRALRLAGWPDDAPVWTGSCPCQPFSAAGRRKGHADERHLWPAWLGLIRERRPAYVFGEQVASPDGLEWLDAVQADLEGEGYAVGAVDICAAGIGAPHGRQRVYFGAYAERDQGTRPASEPRGSDAAPRGRTHDQSGRCGDALDGPDAGSERRNGEPVRLRERGPRTAVLEVPGRGADGRGDADGNGREVQNLHACRSDEASGEREAAISGVRGEPVIDSDTERAGLQGLAGHVRDWRGPGWLDPHAARSVAQAGATRGFWEDCDWWWGRDGKWRPAGPGVQPLAHGVPARVGRLRAYGNAIAPVLAAEFVMAFMEAIGAWEIAKGGNA